jgi:acylphosphatase
VSGRVQGVGFRYSALNKARTLGLKGWVRNEPDGSVTVRFEGEEDVVHQYAEWLSVGPAYSHVTSVTLETLEPDSSLETFHVIYFN